MYLSIYLPTYLSNLRDKLTVFPERLAYRNGIEPTFEAKTYKGKSAGVLLGKTFFSPMKSKNYFLSPWLSSVSYEDMMLGTFAATL